MAATTYKLDWQTKNVRFYAEDMTFLESAIPDGATSVTFNSATKRIDFHGCTDPWVKVGTTTIDGDAQTIAGLFGLSVEGLSTTIAYLIKDRIVVHVGGRAIMPVSAEFTKNCDGFVSCDIIRRQSEIDAERDAEVEAGLASVAAQRVLVGPCDANGCCPECGPHGNGGRVQLAESWAACTVCAGGRPGDVWGGVIDERPRATIAEVLGETLTKEQSYDNLKVIYDEWRNSWPSSLPEEVLLGKTPSGFTVPSKAEVENYIRHCAVQGKFTT